MSRLPSLRPLLVAVVLLVLIVIGAEVGLRVHDSYTGTYATAPKAICFVVPSLTVHHRQRPHLVAESVTGETIALNSFGFRGDEPTLPKPPGSYRVLCLGDELLLADHLPLTETIPAMLAERLGRHTKRRLEVINGGVVEYCPLLSCLDYRHHLQGLQADLVLLFVRPGDRAEDAAVRRYCRIDPVRMPLSCPHPDLAPDPPPILGPWHNLLLARLAKDRLLGEMASDGNSSSDQKSEYDLDRMTPPTGVRTVQYLEPVRSLQTLVRGGGHQFAVCLVGDSAADAEPIREATLELQRLGLRPILFTPPTAVPETEPVWTAQHNAALAERIASTIIPGIPSVFTAPSPSRSPNLRTGQRPDNRAIGSVPPAEFSDPMTR